jgi:hypothetical protein
MSILVAVSSLSSKEMQPRKPEKHETIPNVPVANLL